MPAPRKKRTKRLPRAPKADSSLTFSYKRYDELFRYINGQGMIAGRERTGLSQKQQRRMTAAVKHARHLALVPFTQTL